MLLQQFMFLNVFTTCSQLASVLLASLHHIMVDVKKNKRSNCCRSGKMLIQHHLLHRDEFKAWLMPVLNIYFEVYWFLWKIPIKLGMLGIGALGLHSKHVATVNGLRHMTANSQFYCSRSSPSSSKLLGGDTTALWLPLVISMLPSVQSLHNQIVRGELIC